MILKVRLRTGFYETKPYRLSSGRGALKLLPEEPGEEALVLPKEKILSVTFLGRRSAGAEIQTADRIYHITLCDPSRSEALDQFLKESLGDRMTFEFAYEEGQSAQSDKTSGSAVSKKPHGG
ncbi:MAG TPA: hypothetical protein PKV62_03730 [Oscillospiraceae bacterium]|nr:hypothetical protein [Oscillospiraceae bacterium]